VSAVAENPVRQHFYEGMFLVDSGKFATDPDGVTGEIMTVLAKAGATVVAHRPWQDGKLAYEIQGMKKGLHYIVCFTMRGAGMKTLIRQCQLNDTIIRQMIIAHTQQIFDATVAAITGAGASPEADAPEGERPTRGRTDREEVVDVNEEE
jgi:small subunit ribosomal protein S6